MNETEQKAGEDILILDLPPDVKTRPSRQDLERLTTRLNATSEELNSQRQERDRTPVAGLAEKFVEDSEYGHGSTVLIAIRTDALNEVNFHSPDRATSTGIKEVSDLFTKATDFTDIPPIFLFWNGRNEKFVTADGRHRLFISRRDRTFEYILAYIPQKDLPHLLENNIPYKMVAAKPN